MFSGWCYAAGPCTYSFFQWVAVVFWEPLRLDWKQKLSLGLDEGLKRKVRSHLLLPKFLEGKIRHFDTLQKCWTIFWKVLSLFCVIFMWWHFIPIFRRFWIGSKIALTLQSVLLSNHMRSLNLLQQIFQWILQNLPTDLPYCRPKSLQ